MSDTALPPTIARQFTALRRRAQRRIVTITVLQSLPVVLGLAALAHVVAAGGAAAVVIVAGLVVAAWVSYRRGRRYDLAWLFRQLDRHYPALDDSTALVVEDRTTTRLQALQKARLLVRIQDVLSRDRPADFRTSYPRRSVIVSLLAGLVLAAVAGRWPMLSDWAASRHSEVPAAVEGSGSLQPIEISIRSEPPAYTGLSPQTLTSLDLKVPVDSELSWRLRFDHEPKVAALVFHDGGRLELTHGGDGWRATRRLAASALYRVEVDGQGPAPGQRLNRLDAVPDQPPAIMVRAPDKTLTLVDEPVKTWDIAFEASDDYGLDKADLSVTLAQGTGEQVKVTEQTFVIEGDGDRHRRRYRKTLDLAALGFAQGDDLVVRIGVTDNHPPEANRSSSASYILRWPVAKEIESAGLDGLAQKTLPAYFRSERQIIIDTEALQAQSGSIPASRFAKKADELGVDQKVLRLRYGQFLGEGFENEAEHRETQSAAAGKASADVARRNDDATPSASLKDVPSDEPGGPAAPARRGLGQEEDVLHEFGHAHDNGEAATLLDPETRRILKMALDEMWQAELNLRQASPDAALPFEYRALDDIKQVQQAERIYLQRAGLDLPQVDASRRLSGDRGSVSDRTQSMTAASDDRSSPVAAWDALNAGQRPDAVALSVWLRDHPEAVPDPLGLVASADSVQRSPSCETCRADLKARLWPLLPVTRTGVMARRLPDAAGSAYLETLREAQP